MAPITPVRIRLTADHRELEISWSSGDVCRYPLVLLRKKCPCATCQEDQKQKGAFYIPLFTADALTLTDVKQLGHYAVQLIWGDGHHTGIYNYPYLREICAEMLRSARENDTP